MGNVTLPTPVFLAGGALCVLAGYLVGNVVSPNTPDRTTATVASYDSSSSQLCLSGSAIKGQDGVDKGGELCGDWRRTPGSADAAKGDRFRFVSVTSHNTTAGADQHQTVIYGNVVK